MINILNAKYRHVNVAIVSMLAHTFDTFVWPYHTEKIQAHSTYLSVTENVQ